MDKVKCVYECVVTIETDVPVKEEELFDITKDTFVVYISGHDTTMNTKRANSDVNILAVINPETKQILLINSPRDSYIQISVSDNGDMDKLTHCGTYGVECSMDTLGELYDLDIKYYAQLNFTGFSRLVDAVGGISVYSEKEIETHDGFIFVKGTNYLNGEQALRFVRERKLYGGDRVRGRHQMEVIKGLINRIASGALLFNYNEILDSMGEYFKTNVSQEELSALVKMQLSDMEEWNVQTYAITGTGDNKTTYSLPNLSTYVMIIDPNTVDHAKTLIDMVYDGEVIEEKDLELPEVKESN
jgi:LCP family protein required for cell wall assembly